MKAMATFVIAMLGLFSSANAMSHDYAIQQKLKARFNFKNTTDYMMTMIVTPTGSGCASWSASKFILGPHQTKQLVADYYHCPETVIFGARVEMHPENTNLAHHVPMVEVACEFDGNDLCGAQASNFPATFNHTKIYYKDMSRGDAVTSKFTTQP